MTDSPDVDDLAPSAPAPIVAVERVVDAVRRADDSLTMLDSVRIASTQAARNALRDTRLRVLERMLDEVRAAVGVEAPPASGQAELEVDA